MSELINSKITYNGISNYIPYDINFFTQSNINKVLKLDDNLCDIDEILKVSVNLKNNRSRLVKTALGTSLEGQCLTGWKYITEGIFNIRFDYCGFDAQSSIYTFKKSIYFNSAIALSEDTNYNYKIIDTIFIEDIFSQVLNKREVLVNINYLFTAEI